MAANIGGFTLHSWAELSYKKNSKEIVVQQDDLSGPSSMALKCSVLRFVIIDEFEAAACETLSDVERSIARNMPDSRRSMALFSNLNVIFFGDLWQLQPIGVWIAQNPFNGFNVGAEGIQRILAALQEADPIRWLYSWSSGSDSVGQLHGPIHQCARTC